MRVLDEAPLVPAETLALALWTAEYYLCGPGEAVALTMPPAARARADAFKRQRVAVITDAGRKALDGQERLTETQRALLTRLAVEDACPVADLLRDGTSDAVLARLKDRGLVDVDPRNGRARPVDRTRCIRTEGKGGESPLDLPLTAEQSVALASLESLASADAFAVALLHGVTGSGKTQVYLRLADAVRRRGRRVLILVPEIALTPAMAALGGASVRRQGCGPAQRPLGRRAPRSVAPHPPRRRRRRRRDAFGSVRAARRMSA